MSQTLFDILKKKLDETTARIDLLNSRIDRLEQALNHAIKRGRIDGKETFR